MAATMEQMREGLAGRLSTVAGWQASAYMLASPTPPSMHVFPEAIEYDATMHRGMDRVVLIVQAYVGYVSDIGAQKKLDALLAPSGATSLKTAVEGDKTLGGVVQEARVTRASGYRVYMLDGRTGGGAVLGCEWSVSIIT